MNYWNLSTANVLLNPQWKWYKEGEKLLLHACCAPCSSAVLERIANYFTVTIFYYNPNITNKNEYNKRIEEVKKFIYKYQTILQKKILLIEKYFHY